MPETIGQQLKQAREARNLTIKKVTQATHIQARLIEAIESDDFESLSSPVQARAFLRLYAEFLELSLDDLIARQQLGVAEPSAAFHNAEPAPDQSQQSEVVIGKATTGESVSKPLTDKSLLIQGKIKGFISRIQRILPQPKISSVPVETVEQIKPSEPESISDRQVESIGEEVEEPIAEMAEELFPPDKISSEHQESRVIFTSIGNALHQRREALSLTFDEIEQHTHVREHYLQALEGGDFDHLPSSVQTRGMLNNYAHFLDMDVDAILLQFAEGLQAQRLERQPVPVEKTRMSDAKSPSKTNLPTGLRRYLSMDVLVGVGLVLILLVFAFWGTSRVIGLRSASTPQPTAQSISDILVALPEAGTATPVSTNEAVAGAVIPAVSPTTIVTIPAAGQGPIHIVVVALQQAFVRVTVDGKKSFEGRVAAGAAYSFDGESQIEILTGNGAAVSILFNQSDLGPMGSFGEVVNRIYTANAILNPTATFTPTPTISPIPSLTPRPSPTPLSTSIPQNPVATQAQK
jgi:cytoskeleton protein RodZ